MLNLFVYVLYFRENVYNPSEKKKNLVLRKYVIFLWDFHIYYLFLNYLYEIFCFLLSIRNFLDLLLLYALYKHSHPFYACCFLRRCSHPVQIADFFYFCYDIQVSHFVEPEFFFETCG